MRPALAFILLIFLTTARAQSPDASDWGYTGGDAGGQRFSSLAEIHRGNVQGLAVAWVYRLRDPDAHFGATPIQAFGALFFQSPSSRVVALDPATGQERWRYDPRSTRRVSVQGVAAWEDPQGGPCARRVLAIAGDARLTALDAGSGKPCVTFGRGGTVYLAEGHREETAFVAPPLVSDNRVMVASGAGRVRAFDARTGAQIWSFEAGTLAITAAMSIDADAGILYVASGGNILFALDAASGALKWQHELVHRDVWGFRLAAQPLLIDFDAAGGALPAVVQATRLGSLFVFERRRGAPLFPIVEQPAPRGANTSPTQPFPTTPLLVNPQAIEARDIWGLTFWDRAQCRKALATHRNEGLYTPPDARGAIVPPGIDGGVGTGGLAFDARRGRLIATVNHLPSLMDGQHPPTRWLSPWGFPCTAPPWGTLVSVDLRSHRIVWQVPLGSTQGFGPRFLPVRDFGTPLDGGPLVTAGELVFVGATLDNRLRAFDLETGRELWKHRLPARGRATPMTYRAGSEHRQFVAIVAGGDTLVAFALPKRGK